MRRRFAVLLIWCIVAVSGRAVANSITVTPPPVGIDDLDVHGLYPDGVDTGHLGFLHVGQEAIWTVTLKNISKLKWTDFHIVVISDGNVVSFEPDVVVTGWGTLPPQNFTLTSTTAYFKATAGQVDSPGSTITLTIPVVNDALFLGASYHFQIQASTPEPSSLLLFGTGLIGLVPVLRRKLRM